MAIQLKSYVPPAAVRYGTVRGLTASTLKCSPGTDQALSSQSWAEFADGNWHVNRFTIDPNGNNNFADVFPSRDAAGELVVPDGCITT